MSNIKLKGKNALSYQFDTRSYKAHCDDKYSHLVLPVSKPHANGASENSMTNAYSKKNCVVPKGKRKQKTENKK